MLQHRNGWHEVGMALLVGDPRIAVDFLIKLSQSCVQSAVELEAEPLVSAGLWD